MKAYVDVKFREVTYEVSSWAYVNLQPYRQMSLASDKYNKLTKRFYSPFEILAKVGPVAYKLELPSYSKIYDVFH